MASPAQIEANRRNALKSTGPRTEEGKDASRRNALKHGLAAETLVMPEEEAEAVAARVQAWTPSLKPVGEYDAWLVGEVALCSVRVDRCRAHENALRTRNARRAALSWSVDRRAEAEALGGKLSRSPALTLHKLRATKQGCEWLMDRWEGLLEALETGGGWDAGQERLALDLLGTPKELRRGCQALDFDRKALAEAQLAALESFRSNAMEELDELERAAAEVGLGPETDKEVRLARRYEAACLRRMEWARKQIGKGRPATQVAPPPMPDPRPEPEEDRSGELAELEALVELMEREADLVEAAHPSPSRDATPRVAPPVGNRRARRALQSRTRRA